MLWKTHVRIADEVLYKLGLPRSGLEASMFREGSVAPDKWGDYPHHHGKSNNIRRYILEGRRFFLNGDLPNAYFRLGVALHYIQDSYTSFSSRYESHTQWEQQIEQSHFVDNLDELVAAAFRGRQGKIKEYTDRVECLSREIEGKEPTLWLATLPGPGLSTWHERTWGRPNVDLNLAFKASYLVAKSVLSSKTHSGLQAQLNRLLVEYETMLRESEIIFVGKIVELIRKRDQLNEKRKSGTLQVLKNFLSTFFAKIYNLQAESRIKAYDQQKHLRKVIREYQDAAQNTVAPQRDWFNFTIHEININIVENELLPIETASKHFGIHESLLRYLLDEEKISCYRIRNKELIGKSDLRKALQQ